MNIFRTEFGTLFWLAIVLPTCLTAHAQDSLSNQLRRQQGQQASPPATTPPSLSQALRPTDSTSSTTTPATRSSRPYGPELLGVRLGMTMSEGEALVRRSMSVGRVLETPDPPAANAGVLASRVRGRLFFSADGDDEVVLFQGTESQTDHIVGVWRNTDTGIEDWKRTLDGLVIRHGPPAVFPMNGALWGGSWTKNGNCYQNGTVETWPVWQNDGKSVPVGNGAGASRQVPALTSPNERIDYKPCSAILSARTSNGSGGSSRSTGVTTQLFDMSVLAWIASRPLSPSKLKTPADRVSAGAYGPDVVGLRLGMTSDEAEQIIRAHMAVGRVFNSSPSIVSSTGTSLAAYISGTFFRLCCINS